MNRITYPEIHINDAGSMRNNVGAIGGGEIAEVVEANTPPPPPVVEEDVMFVAVGNKFRDFETVLAYAVQNSKARAGKSICLLHVHQPAQKIPLMGAKVPIGMLQEYQVKDYHENERKEMHKNLDKYIQTCKLAMVQAEKVWIEMESIEKGIVQLISEHGIKGLAMGAASDKRYSRKMKGLKSKKAIHVNREAPSFCRIWFVCKGNLIHTRESSFGGVNTTGDSKSHQAISSNSDNTQSARSFSLNTNQRGSVLQRGFLSDNHIRLPSKLPTGSGWATSPSILDESIDWDSVSRTHTSSGSRFSSSSSEMIMDSVSISSPKSVATETEFELPEFQQSDLPAASNTILSTSLLPEDNNMDDELLYAKLEQYMAEAERSGKALHLESIRRQKAEKDAIDAVLRAKAFETLYQQELKRVAENEKSLARGREEHEKLKGHVDEVMEELRVAQEQKSSLKRQIEDYEKMVEDLEQKMVSAVGILQTYKKEKHELKHMQNDVN